MTQPHRPGILLGHNAFFGVDHLSSARGEQRAAVFSDPARVLDIIRAAREHGAGGMMMSTHERARPITALIAADRTLSKEFSIYPLLPYAQKYVTRANEVGMVNVVLEMVSGASIREKMNFFIKGGKAALTRDINQVLATLIQVELKIFSGLRMPAVFLHDAFTDLALAFGLRGIFEFYVEEIARHYGAKGAFATKNLPLFLQRLDEWGLPTPLVMTHFNRAGYHMNPDRSACEKAAAARRCSILVMGSLASGYLIPDEAYSYLASVPNVEGVVVGVSSNGHIEETFGAISRHLPGLSNAAA